MIKCYCSAFASRNPARALAAALPRQDHVSITTDHFVHFHKDEFDEMLCKPDSNEYARSFRTKPKPTLRQGWVSSKRTCVFSGIQFTRQFIEFVVVETKQIVSSDLNVILTRQTCGQRSGMAAASKRRALAFCFPVRICYMFLMSKCKEESDLGLCMTSGFAKRMALRSADFWRILRPNTFKIGSRHCAVSIISPA